VWFGDRRRRLDHARARPLLAAAQGYRVFAHDGAPLGALERIRYEQQVSRPDEIVVSGRGPFRRRRRTFPFDAVGAISARERKVVLGPDGLDD
jgi:hypothetical protein